MINKLKPAKRILELPPYLFKEIDDKKQSLRAQGKKLINLGIGDPDLPTPGFIVEAMAREMGKNDNQKYPAYEGGPIFRKAVSSYMEKRFGAEVNPDTEVMALIGSKEGIAHFSWAFIDPGDLALVPDPGYPVYGITVGFSGGEVHPIPLIEENGFFPDVSKIPESVIEKVKVIFVNSPNNPTGAVASREQMTNLIDWAAKHGVIIVSDAAYAELVKNDEDRFSLLSLPKAKEVVIEFHSFSKTFNMTGWRIGFAVGNTDLIGGLKKIKTNVDSGVFDAIQLASVSGLERIDSYLSELKRTYNERRAALSEILNRCHWKFFPPEGAFYLWTKCPQGITSKQLTISLMEKAGIVTTPGSGFGKHGEGYFRFALTQPVEVINQIESALKEFKI